jgi:dTDP-4-dehydrorhamnose reductase
VEEAEKKKIRIIHISTDYVFNGENHVPYLETDEVSPLGVYGRSKLEGEEFVVESNTPSMVIRTSWLYSRFGNNFVKTMIRLGEEREELGVIVDQVGTPTNATDLAKLCLQICTKTDLWSTTNEVYHYSNDGVCSWYDFAETIMELSGTTCTVKPIETTEYPTRVTRPHYSVLNKRKIKNQFDFPTIYWRDSLKNMLGSLK